MDPHGDRRAHEAALRAVQKPPAKPWRGGGAAPAPPKVYRVEPREFRELVQRLTGQSPHRGAHQAAVPAATPATQPMAVHGGEEASAAAQFYAPWCSYPMLSPASMAGLDGHHGNGALM